MKHPSASVDKNIVDVAKQRTASSKAVREFRTRLSLTGDGSIAYEQELLTGFAKNQANIFLFTPLLERVRIT